MQTIYTLMALLMLISVLGHNKHRFHIKNSKNFKARSKHRKEYGDILASKVIPGNLIGAMEDSMRLNVVDKEPWNYKMQSQDVYRNTPKPDSRMPEAYNQREDTSKPKGCDKLSFKDEVPEERPGKIYKNDPHAYYDPTYLLKLSPTYPDVKAVPIVWERNVSGDKDYQADRRQQHYNKNYYDPESSAQELEIEQPLNGVSLPLEKYRGQIVTKEKTQDVDEVRDKSYTREMVMHQMKMQHLQPVLNKVMNVVRQRIQDQKNKRKQQELKDDPYYPYKKDMEKRLGLVQ